MPYTAISAEKNSEGRGFAAVKVRCVNAADNPDNRDAVATAKSPKL